MQQRVKRAHGDRLGHQKRADGTQVGAGSRRVRRFGKQVSRTWNCKRAVAAVKSRVFRTRVCRTRVFRTRVCRTRVFRTRLCRPQGRRDAVDKSVCPHAVELDRKGRCATTAVRPLQVNQKHNGDARVVQTFAVGALPRKVVGALPRKVVGALPRVFTVLFPDVLLRGVLCVLDASLRYHGGVAHDEEHPTHCTRRIGPAIARLRRTLVGASKQRRAQRAAQVALAGELVQENAGRLNTDAALTRILAKSIDGLRRIRPNARVRQCSDKAAAAQAMRAANIPGKHAAAQRRQVRVHLLV